MKSFYEFYRRIQANKLFEQGGMPMNPSMSMPPMAGQTGGDMPAAPNLGGMGSMPPGGGMPSGGGMSPQGFMDEGPKTADQEEGGMAPPEAEGEENVDASVGADAEGPEAVMQKAVGDIEAQLDFLRSKGEDAAARADTINDLLKMIKKNIEKAEGMEGEEGAEGEGTEEAGPPSGAMGEEGPPMGDQAVPSFGGGGAGGDMGGMGGGMPQMPMPGGMASESYVPRAKKNRKKK
jgi:hypothetical protein